MQNEKIQVNLAPGMAKAELILREGEAVKELEPKAPVKTDIKGTIGTVREYLGKRIDANQFEQKRSYIIVNRDMVSITLIINENDEYLRGRVFGKLEVHPSFAMFGINTAKKWTPSELGMFFKMNRAFFADRTDGMKLVSTLMNFTATVNNKLERSISENGNKTDNFTQVVNSNLPPSFMLKVPLFKGMPAEILEVETFAHIDGRSVAFMLISPEANATLEDLRNKVIDEELKAIKALAPDIAIIEE